jgi:hypothetical protein
MCTQSELRNWGDTAWGAPGATINTAIAMACCFGVSSPFTAHSKAISLSLLNLPSSADRVVEIFLRPASRDQMIQRGVLAGGRGREDLAANAWTRSPMHPTKSDF